MARITGAHLASSQMHDFNYFMTNVPSICYVRYDGGLFVGHVIPVDYYSYGLSETYTLSTKREACDQVRLTAGTALTKRPAQAMIIQAEN